VVAGRTRPSVAVVGDQAPRSRRSGTTERTRDRAGRSGPRRCRIILYVAGGLLGPGYWLCGAVWDGQVFGKSPAEVHFTEFVLASVVVVVASWGLLLILGEATLFALAVFRADDRERYDIYRNLMILWGYVLTLGIPRHFRKLPAQFGALPDDVRTGPRTRGESRPGGGHRPGAGRPGGTCRHEDTRDSGGAGRSPDRPAAQPSAREHDRERGRDLTGSREREDARDRTAGREAARDEAGHVRDRTRSRRPDEGRDGIGSREREEPGRREKTRGSAGRHEGPREPSSGGEDRRNGAGGREAPRDRAGEHEDVRRGGVSRRGAASGGAGPEAPRDRTGKRQDGRGRGASSPREETRNGTGAPREETRNGTGRRETARDRAGERQEARDQAASPEPEGSRPLGPIFPPRPAAEVEVAPIAGSPAVPAPAAINAGVVSSSLADSLPADQVELRNALDLLLRYAAHIGGDESAAPPAVTEPKLCDGKPFGIAAETGGDT
jgi:hypothetical protein